MELYTSIASSGVQYNLYPFSLNFEGNCARFSFIYEGRPVVSVRDNPAPNCLISGREAGDMVFRLPNKNREAFFRARRIAPEKVYSLYQIHSRDVHTIGSPEDKSAAANSPLPPPETFARQGDGMVSFAHDVFCAVTVADCLPVFLLDTENRFFAVLHSGWKGTGIVLQALEIMRRAGSRMEAIAAVLGPCIQGCCYNVDEERAKLFEAEFGPSSPHTQGFDDFPLGQLSRHDNSSWYIDLRAANARLLAAKGVRNIAHCTDCTFTDTRLGSFRREGENAFTRMVAVVG